MTAVLTLALGLLSASPPPNLQTLMALDEKFCADFAARGVEGWLAYFADELVLFRSDGPFAYTKTEAATHYRKVFSDKDVQLEWHPQGGDIAASGDLGYTYGTWERHSHDKQGRKVVRTGKYLTTWKRQRDGTWKIVADLGNADDAEAAPPRPH